MRRRRIRYCIGIDPGNRGGIALLKEEEGIASILELKRFEKESYKEVLFLARKLQQEADGELFCTLEKVHAMPTQGVTSMFHFGENFGFLKGLLFACEIPILEVSPHLWKKEMGVTKEKSTSIEKAKECFPEVNLKPNKRCKKDSDGLAEAILIGLYGLMKREEKRKG